MASLVALNSKLKSLVSTSGFDILSKETSAIASSVQALNSTSLGTELNESLSGVLALNTSAKASSCIAILTENIPGITDQIVKDVSASKTELEAIIGTTADNGFLDVVITCPTPEGIKVSLGAIANPTDQQTQAILANTTPKKYQNQIATITVKDFAKLSGEFSISLASFASAFSNLTKTQTGNVLQDILLQTDDAPISILENFGVPRSEAPAILVLLQEKKTTEAITKIEVLTGKDIETIEAFIPTVPTSLDAQLVESGQSSSTGVYDVASKNNTWRGAATTNEYFDIIATQEQLLIEFIKCPREITEIVFYGHEMTADQILTAKDIHESYNADGNDGIPFHYVVQPGGNLQRGRSIAKEGTYSTTHNKFSIGVVVPHYVNAEAKVQQGATVRQIIEAFYHVWPGGQIFDANEDIGESKVPVGLSISSYAESFKKVNYGGAGRSFSTAQLINASQGGV